MKVTLLVVGKTNDAHFIAGIDEYTKRIRHYLPFDIEVIPELKNTKSLSEEQQKEKEADLLLKSFQPGDHIVLLDEHGKEFRSLEFAGVEPLQAVPSLIKGSAPVVVALRFALCYNANIPQTQIHNGGLRYDKK